MVAPGKREYGAAQPQNAGPPANELGCATAGLAIGGADGGIGKAMVGAIFDAIGGEIFDAIEGLAKAAGEIVRHMMSI
ncbi:MAG: hypothetical protein K6T86_15725 [Pirellulales bacterium]|nr:hypothetical protein [Pirellulales bacterium]